MQRDSQLFQYVGFDAAACVRARAVQCSAVQCSASVPTSDQRYPELKALETAGASYTRELNELKATGRFEYGYLDSVDDFAARHDELVTRGGAAVSTGINTFIGGSSALGAAVASPACLTGIGCLAPIGLTGLSALSFANAWDSAGTITEPYVPTEGARVISSFNPSNATPENSALAAAGTAAAMSVGEMLLLRGSGKLLLGEYGVGAAGEKVYASDGIVGAKGAGEVASIGGKTCVYNCVVDGVTRYVGITDDIVKRGQAHLRQKGIVVSKIRGLDNISRADARAVEQTLIDYHGLGKDGGTLINKINSISSVKNPTKYEQGLIRGAELLKKAGYEGF
ncbi:GIY-YIG nuclease family protein [Pseudomonas alliivorans]|nr:GIY-YIG nuclease family protein [Pseudomonas alliivorans]